MKKKAFEWDLKTIILILVIFLVLFFITKGIAEYFASSGSSQACLLSVIATSRTRGTPTDALDLECKTNFVGDLKAQRSGTQEEKLKSVEKDIADLAYTCWMQFGEGKYAVFEGKMTEKAAHCFICSKFNLDKSKTDMKINQDHFMNYLKENNLGSGKSYYDFLYNGIINKRTMDKGTKIISEKEENIFIKKMNLDNPDLGWLPELVAGVVNGVFHPIETFSLLFGEENAVIPFTELAYNEGPYAVVYFQFSDFYLQQHIYDRVTRHLAEKVVDATMTEVDFTREIPPAYIIITPYASVKDLGCDSLQG